MDGDPYIAEVERLAESINSFYTKLDKQRLGSDIADRIAIVFAIKTITLAVQHQASSGSLASYLDTTT